MANKSVLVTGGAGFIGSHLCEKLLSEGNRVICLDNFITGKKENIKEFEANKKFSLFEADITQPIKIKQKIYQIYNLASPASPVDYQKRPLETLYAGSIGVKNVLEFAKKNSAVFLQASTSEVYGDPLEHPQKETYYGNVNPVGPRACYDESKRFAEALITSYAAKTTLQVRIARIFNTFGPKMRHDDGRVIPNFIVQALKNEPLTIYGDGKQTRSFCYVDDMVEGLEKLMQSQIFAPVNLGNKEEYSMLEIAKKIIFETNSKSKLEFSSLPFDDPRQRNPDISIAKGKLGWQPNTSLQSGLKSTISYFKSEI